MNSDQIRCLIAWAVMSATLTEYALIIRFWFEGRYG